MQKSSVTTKVIAGCNFSPIDNNTYESKGTNKRKEKANQI